MIPLQKHFQELWRMLTKIKKYWGFVQLFTYAFTFFLQHLTYALKNMNTWKLREYIYLEVIIESTYSEFLLNILQK